MNDLIALFVHVLRTKPVFRALFYGSAIALIVYAANPHELIGFDRFDRALWIGAYSGVAAFAPKMGLWFAGISGVGITAMLAYASAFPDSGISFGVEDYVRSLILMSPVVLPALAGFIAKRVGTNRSDG